jgi:hypothetical protein
MRTLNPYELSIVIVLLFFAAMFVLAPDFWMIGVFSGFRVTERIAINLEQSGLTPTLSPEGRTIAAIIIGSTGMVCSGTAFVGAMVLTVVARMWRHRGFNSP